MEIKKVLIANRGEIAIRIIRTLKEMGIKSVAVFSSADRSSLHVNYADEAYYIGPPEPENSYLNIPKILEALKKSKADAIHPGYGFLSENVNFVQAIENRGKIFIGPSAESMEKMGNKAYARSIARKNNIPIVEGSSSSKVVDFLESEADRVGYPVIIKAAAGGGGRGMRKVEKKEDFKKNASLAIKEAELCFGAGEVLVEKYIESAKHIEIQILGDNYGNIIHLGERDCSIQRRHQKLIEEAPSSSLTPELRENIGNTAIKIAKSINYTSAGTVEFLLDKNNKYYFMEMNTRLQVEHPVTEYITGIDIVKEMINIASNRKLNLTQNAINLKGHAIECRINAENPRNDFVPAPGKINSIIFPGGPNIRIDSCAYSGYEIPKYYDSLIAKVISYGDNRKEAIKKMDRALNEFIVSGIKSTIPFHLTVLRNKYFLSGDFNTNFLSEYYLEEGHSGAAKEIAAAAVASIATYAALSKSKIKSPKHIDSNVDKWRLAQKIETVK